MARQTACRASWIRDGVLDPAHTDAVLEEGAEGVAIVAGAREGKVGLVRHRRLDRAHHVPVTGRRPRGRGTRTSRTSGALLAENAHRGQDAAAHLRLRPLSAKGLVHPDAGARVRHRSERGEVVGHRLAPRRRVPRIEPRDRAEHRRGVGYTPGHRADVVERGGEGEHPWRLAPGRMSASPPRCRRPPRETGWSPRCPSRESRSRARPQWRSPEPLEEAPGQRSGARGFTGGGTLGW